MAEDRCNSFAGIIYLLRSVDYNSALQSERIAYAECCVSKKEVTNNFIGLAARAITFGFLVIIIIVVAYYNCNVLFILLSFVAAKII